MPQFTSFCVAIALIIAWGALAQGGDLDAFPELDLTNPAELREASRVLEEELKLAAKPRTYLVIDLVTVTIRIKDRGVDLHRIPITAWTGASSYEQMAGVFRIAARPSVVRRKVDPSATVDQEPISLADMPIHYRLSMTPPFSLDIAPAAGEAPLGWIWSKGKRWWRQFKGWVDSLVSGSASPVEPDLQLTLSKEQAQSLAWSLVDGMPVVIRRPTKNR